MARSDYLSYTITSRTMIGGEIPRSAIPATSTASYASRWDGNMETLTEEERVAGREQRLLVLWGVRDGAKRIGLLIQAFPNSLLVAPPIPNLTDPRELSRRISINGADGNPRWMALLVVPVGATLSSIEHNARFMVSRYNSAFTLNWIHGMIPLITRANSVLSLPPNILEAIGHGLIRRSCEHMEHEYGVSVLRNFPQTTTGQQLRLSNP